MTESWQAMAMGFTSSGQREWRGRAERFTEVAPELARRWRRWLSEDEAGRFVLLWAICSGCAAVGYLAGYAKGRE